MGSNSGPHSIWCSVHRRLTNLFDGVSVMITKNSGKTEEAAVSEEQIKSLIGKAMKDFAASLLVAAEEE